MATFNEAKLLEVTTDSKRQPETNHKSTISSKLLRPEYKMMGWGRTKYELIKQYYLQIDWVQQRCFF